jgi:hypothetical protein
MAMKKFLVFCVIASSSACHGSSASDATDASIDASDDVSAAAPKSGYIGLEIRGGEGRPTQSVAYANFQSEPFEDDFAEPGAPCTVGHVPPPSDAGVVDAGPPSGESAGPIHIVGGPMPTVLTFDGARYSRLSTSDEQWNGGDTIDVNAEGAETPAFMQSLRFPRRAMWASPLSDVNGTIPISRSEALTLQWQPTEGILEVDVGFSGANVGEVRDVRCAFDASTGSGVIGRDIVAQLPLTDLAAMRYASFQATAITRRTFRVADRDIVIEARNWVYSAGAMTF